MLTASDHFHREAARIIDAIVVERALAKNVPVTSGDIGYITHHAVYSLDPSMLASLPSGGSVEARDAIEWVVGFHLDRAGAFYAILATIQGLVAAGRHVPAIPDDAMNDLITHTIVTMGLCEGRPSHFRWPAEAFGAVRPAFLQ